MRALFLVAGSLVALVVLLVAAAAIIGSRLPAAHEASRTIVLPASPSAVYATLTDFANAPSWRPGLTLVEMLTPTRFREHGEHGAVTYEVIQADPARLRVTEIVDRDLGYSDSWTYSLAEEGSGTRLTITERGVVTNVTFRFMSRYVFGHTKTITTYLEALNAHLLRPSPPRP